MQDNKWRKLKAETDQLFFFAHRKNPTPKYSRFWLSVEKRQFWCVSYPFSIWGAKVFFKSYVSQKPPIFFFLFFFVLTLPCSPGLGPSLFIWIPTLPVEIWHYLLSKLGFLLFPGCPSALSLAACADLVADITAVDISVLLLFSVNVLRGCSAFF